MSNQTTKVQRALQGVLVGTASHDRKSYNLLSVEDPDGKVHTFPQVDVLSTTDDLVTVSAIDIYCDDNGQLQLAMGCNEGLLRCWTLEYRDGSFSRSTQIETSVHMEINRTVCWTNPDDVHNDLDYVQRSTSTSI